MSVIFTKGLTIMMALKNNRNVEEGKEGQRNEKRKEPLSTQKGLRRR